MDTTSQAKGSGGTEGNMPTPKANKGKRTSSKETDSRPTKIPKTAVGSDTPGDPNNFGSFFRSDNSEARLAGYLGFECISELRAFLISPPVLDTAISLKRNATRNFNSIMELIHRDEDQLRIEMTCPEQQPSDDESDSTEGKRFTSDRALAKSLLMMETSIRKMGSSSVPYDRQEFIRVRTDIEAMFSQTIPEGVEDLPLALPQLGPHEGEHRMESLNRCLQTCRHMHHELTASSSKKGGKAPWDTRFADLSMIKHKSAVSPLSIPCFMRPKEPAVITQDEFEARVAEVLNETPSLPPLNLKVVWDLDIPTDNRDFLIAELKKVRLQDMPPLIYDHPSHDPRLFKSQKQLNQMLRQMFPCPPLRLDPYHIILEGTGDNIEPFKNHLRAITWSKVKETLTDPIYSAFKLTVQFEAWDPAYDFEDPEDITLLPELEYLVPESFFKTC